MESTVNKYLRRFRRVKDELDKWDNLQSRFISQFRNASSIIGRLQAIQHSDNYGALNSVNGIPKVVLRKQMESLHTILISINSTLDDFNAIVLFLERMHKEGKQLVNSGGSGQLTLKHLHQRLGVKPCLVDCFDGLLILHNMHRAEYLLKSSVIAALPKIIFKSSSSDLPVLRQLLVDEPNIPKEEVQLIFDIIFAEEIC